MIGILQPFPLAWILGFHDAKCLQGYNGSSTKSAKPAIWLTLTYVVAADIRGQSKGTRFTRTVSSHRFERVAGAPFAVFAPWRRLSCESLVTGACPAANL